MAETNKTEKATPKKRRDERKKGNVFKSKDVVSLASLLVGFFLISKLGIFIKQQVEALYITLMEMGGTLTELTVATCGVIAREIIKTVAVSVLPFMLAMVLIAIVANGVQTRFLIAPELLKPKLSKINPLSGLKRMVSVRSLVELGKSIIKIGVILWLVYGSIKDMLVVAPDVLNTAMDESLLFMVDKIMGVVYRVCLVFVFVAILDFAYERYDHEKKLRMTKQEVKDEYKQMEGDPMVKGKRKEKQRALSMNRMMQSVAEADVVVRNPTHFAIALKYDIDADPAPIVLAKGQDLVAQRIIEEAEKHKILITENKPLARSLYESVEINEYIPAEFYNTVAEVMAWVYEQRKQEINPGDKPQ